MSHCFRDAFDVSAMHERKRGEGVPQIVGPDAPRDTGPLEGVMPAARNRTDGPSFVSDNVFAADSCIFTLPSPEQREHVIPYWNVPCLVQRAFMRVGHPDDPCFNVDVTPFQPEKLARAYTSSCRHTKNDHTADMRRGHFIEKPSLFR